ncbi:DUF4476 domain-containing protein [Solirubrum puertoriconensis]|uniref:DUF4476 domain-containing protein n=1 Tax=Solirubrum puertoriconensis TaxID=1751427 RepID=A0A9X0L319_SOLP1|nr:DUF4476 domain-containing protein [Solirubrum puertoriconensis]KUG06021.1 hypothetical protein ASU33_01220 [Solirubrum puertoriconensis]
MKRTLLLCLSLLLLAQVALAIPAGMAVRSERGLPFRLRLDGNRIGGRYGLTQVRFVRLAPGYHWAEFQVPANGGVLNYRTRVQLLPGRETRFVLVTRRGYPPVLQRFDEVPQPGWAGGPGRGPQPAYEYGYQCEPTPYGGPNGWPAPGNRDDWYGRDDDGYSNNGGYGRDPYEPVPGGYGNGGYNNGGYGNNYRHLMTPQEADELLRAIRARSFDDEKVQLAKQAIAESNLRTDDLKQLLSGFGFDEGKVKLAKYAYPRLTDRHNFYQIYNQFSFRSSVSELQRFVDEYAVGSNLGGGYNAGNRHLLGAQDVDQLLKALQARSFDEERVQLAKQTLAESDIRADDLRRLLGGISFDSHKLELAKYAYSHVTDRQNFHRISDAFTSSLSMREVQQYVETTRG